MRRFVCRLHVGLICVGLSLPAAICRAQQADDGAERAAVETSEYTGGPDEGAADSQPASYAAPAGQADLPRQETGVYPRPAAAAAKAPARLARSVQARPHNVRLAADAAPAPAQAEPNKTALPAPKAAEPMNPSEPVNPVERSASEPIGLMEECGFGWNQSTAICGGVEYLVVKTHQTANGAFEIAPNGGSGSAVDNVEFTNQYNSGFRAFLDYQTQGGEMLRFTYTYIFNDNEQSASVPDGAVLASPLGASLNPGDTINATNHVLLNLWDLEDQHPLQLPGCCEGCANWDVNWRWGLRVIDLQDDVKNEVNGPDAAVFTQKSAFVGAGPRVGLEINRQIGQSRVCVNIGADAALLLGGLKTDGSDTPTGFHTAQVVPDFDLRLGVAWRPTCNFTLTTGWVFETFGNATALNDAAGLAFVVPPTVGNLSYDGLFVRGEVHF